MSQWNKILAVLSELDFSSFTPIDLPGETEDDPRGDSCVLLSPKWLADKNKLDNWHIFSSIYDEENLVFHLLGDSLCGHCQPTERLIGGNEDVPASMYMEDARIFFAVIQNTGASICGQCLSALYVANKENSDLDTGLLVRIMKGLKL